MRVSLLFFLFFSIRSYLFAFTLSNLSLNEAEEIALECNKEFRIAQEETTQSHERKLQAVSKWLPAVDYYAEVRQSQLNELTINVYDLEFPFTKRAYASILELNQPIFSTDLIFNLKSKSLLNQASSSAEEQTKNWLLYAVRKHYYAVLLFEKAVEIQQENIDYLSYALEIEEGRREAGDATSLEVHQSKVAVANAISIYYTALRNAKTARNALVLALGINPLLEREMALEEKIFPLRSMPLFALKEAQFEKESRVSFYPEEIEEYVQEGLACRPDLEEARLKWQVTKQSLNAKQGTYLPTIESYVRYSYNDNQLGSKPFGSEPYRWVGGISLKWNLFDSFHREHEIKEARAGQRAAYIGYTQEKDRVEVEIRDTLYRFEEALLSYLSSSDAVSLAEQAREQAQEKLRYGKIAPLEYRDCVNALAQAKNQCNQASFDLMTTYYQLLFATGRS